jgi:glycosyltransferase involved in cell wall biosynthesis
VPDRNEVRINGLVWAIADLSPAVRITIITPSYQQATFLEECLRSVRSQQGVEVEHIVVDGGSTDGSREIIERRAAGLAWWCSERDAGQSDAINKGLAHATGEVCTWVNSDDALLPGALEHVAAAFGSDPALQVYGGRIVHRDDTGDRVFEPLNEASDVRRLFCDPVINQPATYYRTRVLRELGGVDPALRYVMDLSLWWRFLFRFRERHLRFDPVPLAMFRMHPSSKTSSAHAGFLDETASMLHRMTIDAGDPAWGDPLERLHDLRQDVMRAEVTPEDLPVVRGMVMHFLLKWHGVVHRREQYRTMRAMIGTLERHVHELDAWERQRLHSLREQLRPGGWLMFRLRRKLQHLRG